MIPLLFGFGLVALVAGAELLVRGASRLALTLGLSPLVVGLTVVALGTSAPEAAVSVQSSLAGKPDLLVGNVVGSNIANVLLILGVSALLAPLVVHRQIVRLDVPIMIGVSIAVYLLSRDGVLSRGECVLLLLGSIAYSILAVRIGRADAPAIDLEPRTAARGRGLARDSAHVIAGLALLVLGARWLVEAAVHVARALGLGELVIGLTIVAVGTSLPELAASAIASLRGQRDLAVGNVVGSNLMNLLLVLGLAGVIAPGGQVPVPASALAFDMPLMVATALACLPIFFRGHRVGRGEGALFLGYYLAYTGYLVLESQHHAMLPLYSTLLVGFAAPLTGLTLLLLLVRSLRQQAAAPPQGTGAV